MCQVGFVIHIYILEKYFIVIPTWIKKSMKGMLETTVIYKSFIVRYYIYNVTKYTKKWKIKAMS